MDRFLLILILFMICFFTAVIVVLSSRICSLEALIEEVLFLEKD